jgi:hypothetical protein
MIRPLTLVALGLTGVVAYGVYHLKHEVLGLEDTLARLNREVEREREAIHVLEAEWAYLNRPAGLQAMADRFLVLQPVGARQIVQIDDIPARRAATPDRWKTVPLPRPKPHLSAFESGAPAGRAP